MKNYFFNIFALLLIVCFTISCAKQNVAPIDAPEKTDDLKADLKQQIDISVCEINSVCSFLYADSLNIMRKTSDNSRLFLYKNINKKYQTPIETYIAIQAPLNVNEFTLDENDLKNGAANFSIICVGCSMPPIKVGGGKVAGKKVIVDNKAVWLIEASIDVIDLNTNKPFLPTQYFKQYFTKVATLN